MLEIHHQFLVIDYQGRLLKLMIHVLEHLRAITGLLHHAEVLLGELLWRWRWEEGGLVVEPHLGVITPVEALLLHRPTILLLKLLVEVVVVLLQVYYHHGHVVLAVVVRASLISDLLGDL